MQVATPQEIVADQEAMRDHEETVREVRARAQELLRSIGVLERQAVELRARMGHAQQCDVPQYVREVEAVLVRLDHLRDDQYAFVAAALGWRYRSDAIRSWCERAVALGAAHPQFNARLIEDLISLRRVPNAPFRQALAKLMSADRDWATQPDQKYHSVDYVREATVALGTDSRHLDRMLGVRTRSSSSGTTLTLFIDYETACVMANIFNLKPHEAGI